MNVERDDVWTTRDGRTVKITDMDTNHLYYTIKYIERVGYVFERVVGGGGVCAEEMWADIEEVNLRPVYNRMVEEYENRVYGEDEN